MWVAVIVYSIAFIAFGRMMSFHMNSLALEHGFLDGQVPRDGIPDVRVKSTMIGLLFSLTIRPLSYCVVAYDRFEMPSITPWLPVRMFLFMIIFDFFY